MAGRTVTVIPGRIVRRRPGPAGAYVTVALGPRPAAALAVGGRLRVRGGSPGMVTGVSSVLLLGTWAWSELTNTRLSVARLTPNVRFGLCRLAAAPQALSSLNGHTPSQLSGAHRREGRQGGTGPSGSSPCAPAASPGLPTGRSVRRTARDGYQ
jgi:hypothetical protein